MQNRLAHMHTCRAGVKGENNRMSSACTRLAVMRVPQVRLDANNGEQKFFHSVRFANLNVKAARGFTFADNCTSQLYPSSFEEFSLSDSTCVCTREHQRLARCTGIRTLVPVELGCGIVDKQIPLLRTPTGVDLRISLVPR